MMKTIILCLMLTVSLFGTVVVSAEKNSADNNTPNPFGIQQRSIWKTSAVKGRPEPPLPYRSRHLFPHLHFSGPTLITNAPGTNRLFVAEGKGKVYSFPDDQNCQKADLFLDANELVEQLNKKIKPVNSIRLNAVYGLTFHPNFASNRYCYLCYVVKYKGKSRKQHPQGTRVVRLTVTKQNPPQAIVESETEIITWLGGGHNGGCLKFAHDGKLFIATGDGSFAYPPDELKAGQDISNLLSAMLRIDIDSNISKQKLFHPQRQSFRQPQRAREARFGRMACGIPGSLVSIVRPASYGQATLAGNCGRWFTT